MGYIFLGLGIVIAALALYAISLQRQLNDARQAQHLQDDLALKNLGEHQQQLIDDIRFVIRAMLAEQCEITEGVLRLNYLILSLDPDVWEEDALPTLRLHYQQSKAMPIMDAYRALSKQQQFELDNQRFQHENDNKEALMQELRWLLEYPFPNVTLLQSQ